MSLGTTERETYYKFETEATGPIFSRSWMVETDPPFRTGSGFRIRLGSRAFHIGSCRPNPDAGPLGFVGGDKVTVTPEEIGKWVPDEVEEA